MHQSVKVEQLNERTFKVIRYDQNPAEPQSLIIQPQKERNVGESTIRCDKDENGCLHFFLNGRERICEQSSSFTETFQIGAAEGIYGLGIHQNKPLNRRGQALQMVQVNAKITAVPFLTSTGGYAILIDNYSYMGIGVDCACPESGDEITAEYPAIPNTVNIQADVADPFVYYVILAETMDEQIDVYRTLTGKAPLFPKWAYGYFQSKEHYQTQEELLSVAKEFRERKVPIDCIVQDWNYWDSTGWNSLEWNLEKYPDPKKMVDEIHAMHMKLMISVWPSFGPDTAVTKELESVDGILDNKDRDHENWGRVYDPLNEEAADIVWRRMNESLFSKGIDAWWLDSTEPSFEKDSSIALLDCRDCARGENRQHLNCYALNTSANVYRRQRKTTDEKRVLILTRSGFAGQQANATLTWTGDIFATWEIFKQQIPSLLSFSASGIPYSTTDIGAFFVEYPEKNESPEYRELYTRWFWFGAFSPVFRSHGTSTPREIWHFGEPGSPFYDSQMNALLLRYRLMPYIYAAAFRVYEENGTMMRPLAMDFPEDKKAAAQEDTYLFGESLLVRIITNYGQRTADILLPQAAGWYDYFTNRFYEGGTSVTADAPIGHIPVFVKAGSIIVTCNPAQSTEEQDESQLSINLYTGGDADTFYYQDADNSYDYENGKFVKIPLSWAENKRRLTIGSSIGACGEFDLHKQFRISVNGQSRETVAYEGKEITIAL